MARHQLGLTIKVFGAVCLIQPLVPLITKGKPPVGELASSVTVMVDVLPVVLLGENDAEAPVGNPEIVKVIGAAKPCNRLMLTFTDVVRPWTRGSESGALESEKPPTTVTLAVV